MALASAVFLGACSSDTVPQAARSSAPSVADTPREKPRAHRSSAPSPTADAAKPADSKKAKNDDPLAAANGNDPNDPSWLDVSVRVIPDCASIGDKVRIEVRTDPGAHVTISVFYADYLPHDTYSAGNVDSKGRYLYAFQVPNDAPPGNASVGVVGSLRTRKRGASGAGRTDLTIALPGTCG